MKSEKRSHLRVKPSNVQANIFSTQNASEEFDLNAEILDISRTGIRIKLYEPLDTDAHENLKITMSLPESGTPFTVHAKLKHQHMNNEYGLHLTHHAEGSIDDMLFECVKLNDSMLLIKSI